MREVYSLTENKADENNPWFLTADLGQVVVKLRDCGATYCPIPPATTFEYNVQSALPLGGVSRSRPCCQSHARHRPSANQRRRCRPPPVSQNRGPRPTLNNAPVPLHLPIMNAGPAPLPIMSTSPAPLQNIIAGPSTSANQKHMAPPY